MLLNACRVDPQTLTPTFRTAVFGTPIPSPIKTQDGETIGSVTDVYTAYPELKGLEERQTETIIIGDTNLEIINLSSNDVNFPPIVQIYSHVNDVARQFEENGWYYPGVKYLYNNQLKQIDIFARPSIAEKRSLVLLPADYEIPGLNMPDRIGASIYKPYEITFLRIPTSASYFTGITEIVPTYTDDIANIHLIATEACQSSVWVSSPQDTIPRSFIAHEIFCNSLGWHVALSQAGLSIEQAKDVIATMEMDAGFIFNPLPPDSNLYSLIPKIEGLFQK